MIHGNNFASLNVTSFLFLIFAGAKCLAADLGWIDSNNKAAPWANEQGVVAIAGDFDGDGNDDIAFHRPDVGDQWAMVPVLLSDGNGGWKPVVRGAPAYLNEPGVIAIPGDYDGDGRTDIAFYKPGSDWTDVPVLLSASTNSWIFQSRSAPDYVNNSGVVSVAGDFNRDGKSDIAFYQPVSKTNWTTLPVLISMPDGTWYTSNNPAPSYIHAPYVVAIPGDFNGDLRTDIAFHKPIYGTGGQFQLTGTLITTVPVFFHTSTGAWVEKNTTAPAYPNQQGVMAIPGDYNGDSRTDIAFLNPGSNSSSYPILFASDTAGNWASVINSGPSYGNADGVIAVSGNFNGDDYDDIAFYRPGSTWSTVPVMFANGDGSWTVINRSSPSWVSQPVVAVSGDLNGDGLTDLAFHRPGSSWKTVPVLMATVQETASEPVLTITPAPVESQPEVTQEPTQTNTETAPPPYEDGVAIFMKSVGDYQIWEVLENQDTVGDWSFPENSRVLQHTGDFDGNGREDLIIWGPSGIALLSPPKPDATHVWKLLAEVPHNGMAGNWKISTDRQVIHGAGDFNGDGRDEILITGPNAIALLGIDPQTGHLKSMLMHTNGTSLGGWRIDAGKNRIEGIGDFDGNDKDDILITSGWGIGMLTYGNNSLTSIMLKPNGTRFGGWLFDSKANKIQGIGDFNGDGRDGFIVTSGWGIGILGLDRNQVLNSLILKPNGTRFGGWLYDSRANEIPVVGDFDSDGRDEYVVTSGWGIGILAYSGSSLYGDKNAAFLNPMIKPKGTTFGSGSNSWVYRVDDRILHAAKLDIAYPQEYLIIAGSTGIGLIRLVSDRLVPFKVHKYGERVNGWVLTQGDAPVAVGRFINQSADQLVIHRP